MIFRCKNSIFQTGPRVRNSVEKALGRVRQENQEPGGSECQVDQLQPGSGRHKKLGDVSKIQTQRNSDLGPVT